MGDRAGNPPKIRTALAPPMLLVLGPLFNTLHGDWFAYLCAISFSRRAADAFVVWWHERDLSLVVIAGRARNRRTTTTSDQRLAEKVT